MCLKIAMQTKIIIITGKAQSGKDTSANYLISELSNNGYHCDIYPFAGALKSMCCSLFGLSITQCWGSNEQKDSNTKIRWKDLPLCKGKIAKLMIEKYPKTSDDFMTARELMQVLGTDIFRKMDEDCWVRATVERINNDNLDFAIVSDARFPNEIEFLLPFDPIVIKLNRNALSNSHISETALDNYDFSLVRNYHEIKNNELTVAQTNAELKRILEKYI